MSRHLPLFLRLAALALFPALASAQTNPYRFDLKAATLDVPTGPWRVVRVLDARPDRSRLGMVHRGLDNSLTSANFSQPLAAEVQQFISQKLPSRPDARPVVLRILTLTVGEELRANSETGTAELIADFLEPQPDSTYRMLLPVGEVVRQGGLDVTGRHAANVATLLQRALQQLAARPTSAPATETLTQADALAGKGGVASQRFAIQAAAPPKRGFYRTFQEFRDNTPSEPDMAFMISRIPHPGKRWAGNDELQPIYLSSNPAEPQRSVSGKDLWGLSDGEDLLIVHRNRFYKLLPAADGRSYTFMAPALPTTQEIANGAAIGGMAGSMIAASLTKHVTYELHLASGQTVPAQNAEQTDANGFSTNADTAAIYVYRRPDAAAKQPLTFTVNSKPYTALESRDYVALTWRDRRNDLKLCAQLGTGAEVCHAFVPDFSQPTFLECSVPEAGKPPVFRVVPAKEGMFEVKRIRLLRKK